MVNELRAEIQAIRSEWIGSDGSLDVALDSADQADAIVAVLDRLGVGKAAAFRRQNVWQGYVGRQGNLPDAVRAVTKVASALTLTRG